MTLACLGGGLACSGTQNPDLAKSGAQRPFIKLANRNMGLVIQWAPPAPSAAYRETLAKRLRKNLRRLYRNDVTVLEYTSSAKRVPSRALLEFTQAEVDDAVFVRVRTNPAGATEALIDVFALSEAATPARVRLPPTRGRKGKSPPAKQVADLVSNKVAHVWTDPGSHPPLLAVPVAHYLAHHDGCAQALVLYKKILRPGRPMTSDAIDRYNEALSNQTRCARSEATRIAIMKDRKASFEVKFKTEDLSESIEDSLKRAAEQISLKSKLRKGTNKPVVVWIRPGHLGFDVRFHADRYAAAATAKDGKSVSFLPYEDTMAALLELKRQTLGVLPKKERAAFGAYLTTIRLTRPDGRRVAIDVTELDGRVLYPDTLRLLRETGGEIEVTSVVSNVATNKRWVLGPVRNALGEATAYARVRDFFELEP